jgi:uncharacterized protein involved in type VI secretion and phage assembly
MASDAVDDLLDAARRRFYGKYRGLVADNADPTHRGRLQVSVPAVMGDSPVWALPCVAYAGDSVGFFLLPDVGTGVWVEFEAGNPDYPIWVGCFWGDGQIATADAVPGIKFLKTASVSIRIDDDAGELVIENSGGSSFKLGAMAIEHKSKTITQTTDVTQTVLDSAKFDVSNGAFTVI